MDKFWEPKQKEKVWVVVVERFGYAPFETRYIHGDDYLLLRAGRVHPTRESCDTACDEFNKLAERVRPRENNADITGK